MKIKFIIFTLIFTTLLPFSHVNAGIKEDIAEDIADRNRQIAEIQKQIDDYQKQVESAGGKAKTLNAEIGRLNTRINRIRLEIQSLGLSIQQTNSEIGLTQEQITEAQKKLELQRAALAKYIRALEEIDRDNIMALLLKNTRLSDFFDGLKNLQDTQNKARSTIVAVKALKNDLEEKETDLEGKKEELEQLKVFQQAEKGNLDSDKRIKDRLLKETKGQEAKYQQLVKQSEKDIQKIREQIFYLEQNGVTVEDAIKYGQLAAIRADIRPAFLIAVLEVESGLGRNVGTGNWLKDMYNCYVKLGKPSRAEAEKAAFMTIVGKLGLNPDTVKVSREPNYGCGGALGPAQFLPTTWLGYEQAVSRLVGRPANPWNIEDAFMASALKLARGGATSKTRAGEIAAAKAYVSGSTTCTKAICISYSNAVLSKAAVIQQNL